MTLELLTFLVMAVAILAGGIICLWSRYVVHSAFGLMLSLIGVAGFYVLLNSDFLAVTQIVIYVGGVVVLYLFGVMLTPPDMEERSVTRVAVLAGIALLAVVFLLRGVARSAEAGALNTVQAGQVLPAEGTLVNEVGRQFLRMDAYLLPFEVASILLLVALVGSVFIARRTESGSGEAAS